MDNLIWIISSAIILVLVSTILNSVYKNSKIKNTNKNNEIIILKPNKIHSYVGIAGLIIFPILIFIGLFFLEENSFTQLYEIIPSCIIGVGIYTIFIYLTFFYLNYKIILYEDYFVYQNFFRCKKILKYGEIKIDNSKMYTTIQIKKKNGKYRNLFKLNPYLDNSEHFMDYYNASKKSNKSKSNKE